MVAPAYASNRTRNFVSTRAGRQIGYYYGLDIDELLDAPASISNSAIVSPRTRSRVMTASPAQTWFRSQSQSPRLLDEMSSRMVLTSLSRAAFRRVNHHENVGFIGHTVANVPCFAQGSLAHRQLWSTHALGCSPRS
jgi:hypothetical protein